MVIHLEATRNMKCNISSPSCTRTFCLLCQKASFMDIWQRFSSIYKGNRSKNLITFLCALNGYKITCSPCKRVRRGAMLSKCQLRSEGQESKLTDIFRAPQPVRSKLISKHGSTGASATQASHVALVDSVIGTGPLLLTMYTLVMYILLFEEGITGMLMNPQIC